MEMSKPATWVLEKMTLETTGYGKYCLNLKYNVDTDSQLKEVNLLKVELPIKLFEAPHIICDTSLCAKPSYFLRVGDIDLPITGGITELVIEEKTHEMTLEEIEKKLGYKIKIVSEGKKI